MRRRTLTAAALALVLSGASGCSATLGTAGDLPLPGGADLGGHPFRITAEFTDVTSLVPQAAVKVNDVAVGRVTGVAVTPGRWTATVTMKVNGAVRLPANAYARVAQSSLLGEKYVELSAPPDGRTATGRLTGGAAIPVSRTDRDPEVEEVFGALSMVLNGGGVAQLRTITTELNKALAGNEPQVRSLLGRLATLTSDLDAHRGEITAALDGVDRLSATLATRDRQIGTVLTGLSPGLKVLDQQRGALLTMLRSLDALSSVAVDTVNRSKDDMVADLTALAPTLRRLADAGKDLPDSLQVLLTYPFTDEVLRGIKGDYLNVYLDLTAAPGTRVIPPMDPDDNVYPQAPARRGAAAPPLPLPSTVTPAPSPSPSASTSPPPSPAKSPSSSSSAPAGGH
ncbi:MULTISPECIES: MCE family protein [Streptomycetaceae]|uniref:Virulence factor Mce family protein n=1 Tax=Streptantibioticus cattleyicolor (strain ATCC 35852 / DSM 46488 / JCM 4925 / NBRC 14057 / NRRL 8057) TaxID=1003195 RepID=F8JUH3_STREN|nr:MULTISPECIES: MCE family protein [Streptomycetaceae]AEW95595.1 virulence factor Mce family protein [Streptantibioticus cattleyicolor NRRL 8057 = DSM 46488]MYS60145.1 MCE family protein [Streptomyces sp. SID5468]CCB75932.1 putative Mce family protein [Streptantibioticus cattleyicolor NRRL 8057 = DSM 46488]